VILRILLLILFLLIVSAAVALVFGLVISDADDRSHDLHKD